MSVADRGRALEALERLGAPVVALGSLNADLTVTTQRLLNCLPFLGHRN